MTYAILFLLTPYPMHQVYSVYVKESKDVGHYCKGHMPFCSSSSSHTILSMHQVHSVFSPFRYLFNTKRGGHYQAVGGNTSDY